MKRFLFLLVLMLMMTRPLFAQFFSGQVINETNQPIPYAALYFREISTGFTCDENGEFRVQLPAGSYTCEISSLGYKRKVAAITMPPENLHQVITLFEQSYQLREVVITRPSEEPAYHIMRQVIAYGPHHQNLVQHYQAETYLKGTGKITHIPALFKLSKEAREFSKQYKDRLFVLEEHRHVTFKAPNSWENVVKAGKNSFPEEMNIKVETVNLNLYYPTLFNRMSPIGPNAFAYYQFKLEGEYYEDERLIYKIKVIPRNNHPDLVSGYLYVVDELWCLSAVNVSFSFPGVDLSVGVTCKEIRPDVFVNTSITMKAGFKMMGAKGEASYFSSIQYLQVDTDNNLQLGRRLAHTPGKPITKKQIKIQRRIDKLSAKEYLTTKEAYQLSKLIDDAIFLADTTSGKHKYERKDWSYSSVVDSLATKRNSTYWDSIRSVPLTSTEIESYIHKEYGVAKVDTTQKGILWGKIGSTLLLGRSWKSSNGNVWISSGGLPSFVPEFNFVDGLWLGARLKGGVRFSPAATLYITPQIYYTTGRHHWLGHTEVVLEYAPRRLGRLRIDAGEMSADYNQTCGESRLINALASAFLAQNNIKFFNKRFLRFNNDIELGNSLLLFAGVTWQKRTLLKNTIHHSLFGKRGKSNDPENSSVGPMPENELLKAGVELRYAFRRYYRMAKGRKQYFRTGMPELTFKYERAFPFGGSDKLTPSFHLTELTAEHNFIFGLFNRISWYVNAGSYWDTKLMQLPDYKHFATTSFPIIDRFSDQGLALQDNYPYSSNVRWAKFSVSYFTPYLLLKNITALKLKRFDEGLHLNMLTVYKNDPYWETGYSIGRFDLFRVGAYVGFKQLKAHYIGVNLSVSLPRFLE